MPSLGSLPAVVARREAQEKIAAILKALPPEDRRFVLEGLLDEIYTAAAAAELPQVRVPEQISAKTARTADPLQRPLQVSQADAIVSWCKENPTQDGTYTIQDAARALLPNDKAGTSKIYSAVVRASPQSDRTPPRRPRFTWLGNSTFKLYTEESSTQ